VASSHHTFRKYKRRFVKLRSRTLIFLHIYSLLWANSFTFFCSFRFLKYRHSVSFKYFSDFKFFLAFSAAPTAHFKDISRQWSLWVLVCSYSVWTNDASFASRLEPPPLPAYFLLWGYFLPVLMGELYTQTPLPNIYPHHTSGTAPSQSYPANIGRNVLLSPSRHHFSFILGPLIILSVIIGSSKNYSLVQAEYTVLLFKRAFMGYCIKCIVKRNCNEICRCHVSTLAIAQTVFFNMNAKQMVWLLHFSWSSVEHPCPKQLLSKWNGET
jgi:hypothetical protein